MTVWAENPEDGGSTIWRCDRCVTGAWCGTKTEAWAEALRHAQGHGLITFAVLTRRYGPRPVQSRDDRIREYREQGKSIRAIALLVGLSTAGVTKALRRIREKT